MCMRRRGGQKGNETARPLFETARPLIEYERMIVLKLRESLFTAILQVESSRAVESGYHCRICIDVMPLKAYNILPR